jgi:tetratricopeptide (TPR) repeat protein
MGVRGTRCSILAAAAILAAIGLARAAPTPPEPAYLTLARAEQLYERGQLAEARAGYLAVLKAEPHHFEALCRLVRVETEMGERATGAARRRLKLAAVEHARTAVQAGPDSSRAYLWLAIALGSRALIEGPRVQASLARQVRTALDRALALNPNNDRAYHLRGLLSRRIALLSPMQRVTAIALLGGLPRGATLENALRDFERAAQLDPYYVDHRLELGRTYLLLKRYADARRELETAVSLPATSSGRDVRYQAEARKLLATIPQKG